MTSIDTVRFIKEIKARPVIWNTKYQDSISKAEKNKAWDEIYTIFYKNKIVQMNTKEKERAGKLFVLKFQFYLTRCCCRVKK